MRSAVGIEHSIQKPTGNHASRSIAAATTDSHGRYEIPAPERSFFQGLYTSYHLQPYKSGLAFSPVSWNGEGPRPLAMVSANDTTEGQLREIRLMLGYAECLQVPIAQAATLLPFYRLLLSDAIRLGAESDDPGLLRMVCGSISSVGRDDSQAKVGAVSTLIPGPATRGKSSSSIAWNRDAWRSRNRCDLRYGGSCTPIPARRLLLRLRQPIRQSRQGR